jgi:hypothetical protein
MSGALGSDEDEGRRWSEALVQIGPQEAQDEVLGGEGIIIAEEKHRRVPSVASLEGGRHQPEYDREVEIKREERTKFPSFSHDTIFGDDTLSSRRSSIWSKISGRRRASSASSWWSILSRGRKKSSASIHGPEAIQPLSQLQTVEQIPEVRPMDTTQQVKDEDSPRLPPPPPPVSLISERQEDSTPERSSLGGGLQSLENNLSGKEVSNVSFLAVAAGFGMNYG